MIVYTGGTFDLLHAGHVEFLHRLWQISGGNRFEGSVTVSLNTDEFIEEYKGRRPINSYDERFTVLSSCRYVSRVIENTGGADSKVAILEVKPDIVAIGSDWHDKDYLSQMQFDWEWLHEHNISLLYVPRVTPISTTDIRRRINDHRSNSVPPPPTAGPEISPRRAR